MDSPGMQQCRDRVYGTLQRGKYGTGLGDTCCGVYGHNHHEWTFR
jgi:hypothetical protein